MFVLDYSAHTNALRGVHPGEKLAFSLAALTGVLVGRTLLVPFTVFAVVGAVLIFKARVHPKTLARFLATPLVFLLLGLPALLVSLNPGDVPCLARLSLWGIVLGIPRESASRTLLLSGKVLGASSAFGFLVLTTPLPALDQALSALRLPPVLRTLCILMYRFVFIVFSISAMTRLSQRARGGFSGFVRSIRSLADLAASLFVRSYGFARLSHGALVLRGFDENFEPLPESYAPSAGNRRGIKIFILLLLVLLLPEAL